MANAATHRHFAAWPNLIRPLAFSLSLTMLSYRWLCDIADDWAGASTTTLQPQQNLVLVPPDSVELDDGAVEDGEREWKEKGGEKLLARHKRRQQRRGLRTGRARIIQSTKSWLCRRRVGGHSGCLWLGVSKFSRSACIEARVQLQAILISILTQYCNLLSPMLASQADISCLNHVGELSLSADTKWPCYTLSAASKGRLDRLAPETRNGADAG